MYPDMRKLREKQQQQQNATPGNAGQAPAAQSAPAAATQQVAEPAKKEGEAAATQAAATQASVATTVAQLAEPEPSLPAPPLGVVWGQVVDELDAKGKVTGYRLIVGGLGIKDLKKLQFASDYLHNEHHIGSRHPGMVVKFAINLLIIAIKEEVEKRAKELAGG